MCHGTGSQQLAADPYLLWIFSIWVALVRDKHTLIQTQAIQLLKVTHHFKNLQAIDHFLVVPHLKAKDLVKARAPNMFPQSFTWKTPQCWLQVSRVGVILFFKFDFKRYMILFTCASVCMCECMHTAEEARRQSSTLELEIQAAMSHPV